MLFFYCVAERAVKPCRSSRSKTRGGMIKSHDTCKTGSKHQNPNNKNRNQTQANTKNDQVSVDGETCGEKKVKRPKLSCVELHQEAKSITCPAQLRMKLISHSIVFTPFWIGICARGSSIVRAERCITNIRECTPLKTVSAVFRLPSTCMP